jgi:tricarballylate dehydrogenase
MGSSPLPATADVVVVGGGNAALCAALSARRHVSRVLVLEAAPFAMRGGNTRHTRNIRHIHDGPDAMLTGSYSEDELWKDLVIVSDEDLNESMALLAIRGSQELPTFLEEHGVHWQDPLKGTLHLSRTNRFFLGGGKAMLNALYSSAHGQGIDVRYETPVVDFIFEDGGASGVVVESHGARRGVRAGAVVVASGGYQANREWLRENWGPAADNFVVRGSPFNRGGPLRALLDRGVSPIGNPRGAHAISVDARAPAFDGGIVTRIDSVPLSIMVNRLGERFADEGQDLWPRRYASWGHLIAAQPGQIAYSIFDSKVERLFIPGLYPPYRDATPEGLADQLGLSRVALSETITRFNDACPPEGGFDHTDLDGQSTSGLGVNKSNWALRIDTPPFFAYPLRPGITFTYMGVKVDEQARVQSNEGPLDNLFAAGEIMSGNVLTAGYLAGFGLTIGGVFGRIAGGEAGRVAARTS